MIFEQKYAVKPDEKPIKIIKSTPFWVKPENEKELPIIKYPLADRIKAVDKEIEQLDDCFSRMLKFCYK